MMRGGGPNDGWGSMINAPDERPRVTLALLQRVLNYAAPYRWQISAMFMIILLSTGLSLLMPLILSNFSQRTHFNIKRPEIKKRYA